MMNERKTMSDSIRKHMVLWKKLEVHVSVHKKGQEEENYNSQCAFLEETFRDRAYISVTYIMNDS